MAKKAEQPDLVCRDCGNTHGRYTIDKWTKWSVGTCDICRKHGKVTTPWNWAGLRQTWKQQ